MKDIIVMYHADCLDGFGSAFIAHMQFGDDADYIPVKYNRPVPEMDYSGKAVYLLDFAYPREEMLALKDKCGKLICLDHHIGRKNDIAGIPGCHFFEDRSGVGATWFWFNDAEMPLMFEYIQDRDLWKFKYFRTKMFCAALHAEKMDFSVWGEIYENSLNEDSLSEFCVAGSYILKADDKEMQKLLKNRHPVLLLRESDSVQVLGMAVNASPRYASEIGHKLAMYPEIDFGMVYSYNGAERKWMVQLRSTDEKADVCEIAKRYGGGGHRNASGFSCDDIIWNG